MSEADAVALSTNGPVTRDWLCRDLTTLGVKSGMVLMVHASLSRIGWVPGGPVLVVEALRELLGPAGTLVMPAFCGGNTDPAQWQSPPVPGDWVETIYRVMPAFDPATSPTRIMGAIAEYFRTLPGVRRSSHPAQSWAAIGPEAERITAEHSLNSGDGSGTPLGHCYDLGAHVLTLGTQRTTILHLADFLTEWTGKYDKRCGSAMLVDGERRWVEYEDHWSDAEDFEDIRQAFMREHEPGASTWQAGKVCYSDTRLFAAKPLVDFGVEWIREHRK